MSHQVSRAALLKSVTAMQLIIEEIRGRFLILELRERSVFDPRENRLQLRPEDVESLFVHLHHLDFHAAMIDPARPQQDKQYKSKLRDSWYAYAASCVSGSPKGKATVGQVQKWLEENSLDPDAQFNPGTIRAALKRSGRLKSYRRPGRPPKK
jgi:hypothetical protein